MPGTRTAVRLDTRRPPAINAAFLFGPAIFVQFGSARGAVAQLGERRNRTAEVRGSNPLGSTRPA